MDRRILAQSAAAVAVRMCRRLGIPKRLHVGVYELMARRFGADNQLQFMNYGFDAAHFRERPLALDAAEAPHRFHIQLYHEILSGLAVDNGRVLEIGCGRGGGAAYVHHHLHAARTVGVDLSRQGLRICARTFQRDALHFINGDAERLPFRDRSFDIALNLESSHAYPSINRFVGEVFRVLRPGGFLAYADLHWIDAEHTVDGAGTLSALRRSCRECGFTVIREADISRGVCDALTQGDERWRTFIRRRVPVGFRRLFAELAGLPGGYMYEQLEAGRLVYWTSVLQKPAGLHGSVEQPTIRANAPPMRCAPVTKEPHDSMALDGGSNGRAQRHAGRCPEY